MIPIAPTVPTSRRERASSAEHSKTFAVRQYSEHITFGEAEKITSDEVRHITFSEAEHII